MNRSAPTSLCQPLFRNGVLFLVGLAMVLWSQPPVTFAQWATSGNDIHNTNPGRVGIGTTSPVRTLDTHGDFRVGPNADKTLLQVVDSNIPVTVKREGSDAHLMIDAEPGTADPTTLYRIAGQTVWNTGIHNDDGNKYKIATGTGANNFGAGDVMTFQTNGNVGIGTASPTTKLHVAGDVTVTGNIAAKYQDIAEWVPATRSLEAGTVVVLDTRRTNHVLSSSQAYDTRVAGVVTATPGLLLGEAGEHKVKVATAGRVPVRVDATRGPIRVGDLLVTSDRKGLAMRSEPVEVGGVPLHRPGTLLGKALEPLPEGEGEILVLLSLQ